MIVAGLLSMTTKFAECTLGVKYRPRERRRTGLRRPMFYLSRGLREQGMAGLGKVLAPPSPSSASSARWAAATPSRPTRPSRR
jgi:Na+/alanine symporter